MKKAGGDVKDQDKSTGGEVDPAPVEDDDFLQDTNVRIMVNKVEVDNWDTCNEKLLTILYLTTTGPASSYLLRYEPKGLAKPNGKIAWEALIAKYENSSQQRRRILIRQLDNLKMSPRQDPDEFLTKMSELRDQLVYMGEPISDDRLTDIVVEGLTDDYDRVKYDAERTPT